MKKNTKWLLENKINYERIFENKGEKKLDFVIESLIENRNLSLDTNFDFNPFDLKDIDIAVKRIFEAIENNEKIYIYGDYDVDGITSVSLLYFLGGEVIAKMIKTRLNFASERIDNSVLTIFTKSFNNLNQHITFNLVTFLPVILNIVGLVIVIYIVRFIKKIFG